MENIKFILRGFKMAKKNYLIFDLGASGGRAIVFKFNGETFEMDIVHRFDNLPVVINKTIYWDILRLYHELKNGITLAVSKYKKISAIGIDTWGVDFGFIDKNGALISNPVNYRNKRRNNIQDELFKLIPREELFKLTGGMLLSMMSIFHMYSLKIMDATEYKNAYKFLMMPDLFNYFLTGIASNEYTNVTLSLMYNQQKRRWEEKILK